MACLPSAWISSERFTKPASGLTWMTLLEQSCAASYPVVYAAGDGSNIEPLSDTVNQGMIKHFPEFLVCAENICVCGLKQPMGQSLSTRTEWNLKSTKITGPVFHFTHILLCIPHATSLDLSGNSIRTKVNYKPIVPTRDEHVLAWMKEA